MREPRVKSPVLRSDEAAAYLRLTEDHATAGDAVRALHRLVQKLGLRPIAGMRPYRFSIAELNRWIEAQTIEFSVQRSTEPSAGGEVGS